MEETKIQITELNEEIDNIDELESCLCDYLDNWLRDIFDEEGMTRKPTEEDSYVESDNFRFYTDTAQKLIDAKFKELHQIAKKYDPENADDYNISSYMYREE